MQASMPNIDEILSKVGTRTLNSALFNIAHAYARSGDMASTAIIQTKDADFSAPAIMCKSFAIELLLKFFLVIPYPTAQTKADIDAVGVDLRGHKYSELFDRIHASYQEKIANSFSNISGRPTNVSEFRPLLLTLGDDPFVFWRYIYEKNGMSTIDIPLLENVLFAMGKAAEFERERVAGPTPA